MNKTGDGCTWKEIIVLGWGGLRGALALALALVVETDKHMENDPIKLIVRDLILFHTISMVIMTLLINGTTSKLVLNLIGLIEN